MGPTQNDQQGSGVPAPTDGSGAVPGMPPTDAATTQPSADPSVMSAAPSADAGPAAGFVAPEIKPEDVGLGDEPAATPEAAASDAPVAPAELPTPALPVDPTPTAQPGETTPPADPPVAGTPGTPQQQ